MVQELFNLRAEQELLGALMIDNSLEVEISSILKSDDFGYQVNADIYTNIIKLIQSGTPATWVILSSTMASAPSLLEHGGSQYIKDLVAIVYTTTNAVHQAKLLRSLSMKRRLININRQTCDSVIADGNLTVEELLEQEQQQLFELGENNQEQGFKAIDIAAGKSMEIIEHAYKYAGEITGLATGLKDVDKILGGIHKTDLLIIAGRPGMGKTALVTNIAYNVAKSYMKSGGRHGAAVGFFSLEMSQEQLVTRLIAQDSGISAHKLRQGKITDFQFNNKILPAVSEIKQLPIYIDDSAALRIGTISSRARWLKRKHNVGLLIVDYLQLTQPNKTRENRVTEVSEITQGLKQIAKDLNIPVIALSQLSRNVESREDKRPQLSDLRESGSIEQDADVVGFIYREEYYARKHQPDENSKDFAAWQEKMAEIHNKAEFIISKQRHGPTGTAVLQFDPELTVFCDLDKPMLHK